MAIGLVELQGQITRAQDYTTLKQNEDNKPMLDQMNFEQQMTKQVEKKAEAVNHADESQYHNRKFDAKNKGDNEYRGNGGSGKKEQEKKDGRVLVKQSGHFDISI